MDVLDSLKIRSKDEVIAEKVEQVKAEIATMLAAGLARRRSLFW